MTCTRQAGRKRVQLLPAVISKCREAGACREDEALKLTLSLRMTWETLVAMEEVSPEPSRAGWHRATGDTPRLATKVNWNAGTGTGTCAILKMMLQT